mgnify:FL=1
MKLNALKIHYSVREEVLENLFGKNGYYFMEGIFECYWVATSKNGKMMHALEHATND